MPVTIGDVARHAGTSTATVSHVLNSVGRMRLETRRRVLAAVKELRYYPNLHARNLARHRSRTMGIIVSDIENPFFPTVIRAFETQAHKRGYDVLVSDTNYRPQLTRRAAERMIEMKVLGVAIMTSEMSPALIDEILSQNVFVTFLDFEMVSEGTSNLRLDYLSGIREAIDHLYGFGHRRIAFVGGRYSLRNVKARQVAYITCMLDRGLEPGPIAIGNQRADGGVAAGEALLRVTPRPSAVVAMNDLTAVGVIRAFRQHGLRVPEDVSVVGFDRTYLAEFYHPSLTSVDMQPEYLGRVAAESLLELATASKPQGRDYVVPLHLVVGESTGPAPTWAA
ncbi:MAG: LacI family transcriptional regulator [Acidobacteriia bacterium]|nr:LacI family transcriptional regulator [Terriglobia bacterium]